MNQREKNLRAMIHDRKRARYYNDKSYSGFKSLLDLENSLAEYLDTGHCDEIPVRPQGRTSSYWLSILTYNFDDWKRLVDNSPFNFLSFQVFGLRAMATDMQATVETIVNFCRWIDGQDVPKPDPSSIGFIANMSFWGRELFIDSYSDDLPFLRSEFGSPIMIGEGKLRTCEEVGYCDENYANLFINSDKELKSLMLAVELFLSGQKNAISEI